MLAEELPDAQEVVAYNMPGFGIDGTLIAGYAAFSQQCGLYVSPAAMRANTAALAAAGLKATKNWCHVFAPQAYSGRSGARPGPRRAARQRPVIPLPLAARHGPDCGGAARTLHWPSTQARTG